jgi:hypothetical protein
MQQVSLSELGVTDTVTVSGPSGSLSLSLSLSLSIVNIPPHFDISLKLRSEDYKTYSQYIKNTYIALVIVIKLEYPTDLTLLYSTLLYSTRLFIIYINYQLNMNHHTHGYLINNA